MANGGIVAAPGAATEIGPPARRREQRGWYFYDWANSAFSTTVAAVFLGPYLTALTENAAGVDGFVHPLVIPIRAGSFLPYVLSLSVVPRLSCCRSPVLLLTGVNAGNNC